MISTQTSRSFLDADAATNLDSVHYDQANQVRQHPSQRSKSRAGLLHRETRIHDYHGSTVRRKHSDQLFGKVVGRATCERDTRSFRHLRVSHRSGK